MRRPILLLAFASLFVPAFAAAGIQGQVLPDSSRLERFTLPNGLRVVLRHVPGCSRIAIATAFAFGEASDPAGKEGRSALLAELHYLGATQSAPARTREEMPSLRPEGWNFGLAPNTTWFEEIAASGQFPIVLQQVADRVRGVAIEASDLASARARVADDLAAGYEGNASLSLHRRSGALNRRVADAAVARYAAGRGLEGLSLANVRADLAKLFVPANAALSIAGDLDAYPVRAWVEAQFGSIPAGVPVPAVPLPATPDTVPRTLTRDDLEHAVGVYAVRAPAITDSLHPEFLVTTLLIGGQATMSFGPPAAPIETRFSYSVLDDPTIVRLYPALDDAAKGPRDVVAGAIMLFNDFSARALPGELIQALWRGVDWLLGGPVPPEIMARVRYDMGALHTLCQSAALRELSGGEAFWSVYRERFRNATRPDVLRWLRWYRNRTNVAIVIAMPRGR